MQFLKVVIVLAIVGGGAYLGWAQFAAGYVVGDWKPFASEGGAYEAPDRWDVFDPHASEEQSRKLRWLQESPPDGCHVALLRAPDQKMEVHLICGDETALRSLVNRALTRFDDGAVAFLPVNPMTTYDDLEITCLEAYVTAGPFGGNDMTYFIGHGSVDGRTLIVSAGSQHRGFDFDSTLAIVQSVELPGR